MELWYSEKHTDNVKLSLKVREHLLSIKSPYQQIDIIDTFEFGKMLVLDEVVMLSQKDEFIYHEMITHVPMAVNPNIEKILVIGAGDGGSVTQLLKHSKIKQIDVVEIDEAVVNACKEHFYDLVKSFEDDKVNLYFEDGLKYVRTKQNYYDLIIVDSTDPFGPGEGLFTKEFYGNCFNALKEDGILVNQHESPFYEGDILAMKRAHQRISPFFKYAYVYQAHIPTYPSGHWLFGFASKKYHPYNNIIDLNKLGLKTKYYNYKLHQGSFAIPTYVQELLEEE